MEQTGDKQGLVRVQGWLSPFASYQLQKFARISSAKSASVMALAIVEEFVLSEEFQRRLQLIGSVDQEMKKV